MQTLMVSLKHESGTTRTWKLDPHMAPFAIGSSTHVALYIALYDVESVIGTFDIINGQWKYICLERNSFRSDSSVVTSIQHNSKIKTGSIEMNFEIQDRPHLEFEKLKELSAGKDTHELIICKAEGSTLFTELVVKGADPVQKLPLGALIERIPLGVVSQDHLLKRKKSNLSSSEKIILHSTLGLSSLLLLAALMGPKSHPQMVTVPKSEFKELKFVMKNDQKKKPKAAEPKQEQPKVVEQKKQAPTPQVADNRPPVGGGLLKSAAGMRISQLIGKVSAQAARSKNVVIGTGVAAGSAPSGRALASIGPIDQAGKDWSKEGAKNVNISTIGGKAGSGFAKLSNGKTGQGGVGLIEDESEVTGGLDKEIIAQTIKSNLGQILYCYERQLSASPDLFGKVAVRFTITGNGAVQAPKINETTLKNNSVETCILSRVATWKFPTPQGGTMVNVTYPFLFKSTN